jgi:alpha-mannosidase
LKTLAVEINSPGQQLVKPVFKPVDLPYNLDVMSFDHNRSDGAFGADGWSYPAELMPDSIQSGRVSFKLGPKFDGAKNALTCEGQVISLPEGNFNCLYMLAAASEENQKGVFKLGQKEVEIPVATGLVSSANGDNRLWAEGPAASIDFDQDRFTYIGVTPVIFARTK